MGVIRKVNKVAYGCDQRGQQSVTRAVNTATPFWSHLVNVSDNTHGHGSGGGWGGGGEGRGEWEKVGLRKENQLVFRCLRAIPSLITEVSAVLMISSG